MGSSPITRNKKMLFYIEQILSVIAMIVPLLLAVAFFTLYERQVLAALQRRQGPNIVGFFGILQPIADGLKLLLKESILPKSANTLIFIFSPVFTFGLAVSGWAVVPMFQGGLICDFNLGMLYIFAISSLSVHSVIMAGWSSNSKYAFLGGLRSAAQMISYEVPLGTVMLALLLVTGTFNFTNIVESQKNVWLWMPLFPLFLMFFICALAETNRHPFDLPEAEAELVSGYNVEYSAMGFALFFLAEYSNIILMSTITALFFLGGWNPFLGGLSFSQGINCALKTMFFVTLFVLVRGTLPRYRYDQLMRLGWKVLLPISLACVLLFASILLGFNSALEFLR
jgi:NADH-quinone oxidoreductase subunit H